MRLVAPATAGGWDGHRVETSTFAGSTPEEMDANQVRAPSSPSNSGKICNTTTENGSRDTIP